MIKSTFKNILFIFTAVFLSGCTGENNETKELWVNEEILNHLTEIKAELVSIKKEVASLKLNKNTKKKQISSLKLKPEPWLNKNAKYAIVEFSDFECPYCSRHANTVFPKIKSKYLDTGKIAYQVRDFPLSFHANAKSAAIAAHCAGKQNNYWPMYEKLFQAKGRLNKVYYSEVAAKLKLNTNSFNECLSDASIAKLVDDDISYGNSLGVTGTPRFLIGKVNRNNNTLSQITVVSGAQSFEVFERALKKIK